MLTWVGAGMLTLGLSTVMLASAISAVAEPEAGSDEASAGTSHSDSSGDTSKPVVKPKVSTSPDTVPGKPLGADDGSNARSESDEEDSALGADDEPEVDAEEADAPHGVVVEDEAAADTDLPESDETVVEQQPTSNPRPEVATQRTAHPKPAPHPLTPTPAVKERLAAVADVSLEDTEPVGELIEAARFVVDEQAPATKAVSLAIASAEAQLSVEPAAAGPTLINVIGSIFFSLFDMFAKVIAGPPALPPNSNVRVGRSQLQIDCGDGYLADADWYVPTGQEPPQGVIYLQHGFLAHPGFYNVTAAALAESTNSVVVAPHITSNFLACDSCHLTGDPMHFAVAKLFSGDRAALNASLAAAFEGEDITLPQKYVLAGHSGGASMAAGVAGFASQLGGPNGSSDLAGVILFETNDIGDFVSSGIAKVPLTTPVYYVGGEPALINNFDEVSGVMHELRPNQFTGVHIIGGVHTDIMETTNSAATFVMNLALGTPRPENTAAAKLLAVGWINDMFSAGPDTGIYPAAGATQDIVGEAGTAHVVGLGGPLYQPSFFESLIGLFYGQINNLRFGGCAADVDALVAEYSEDPAGPQARVGRRTESCVT